MEYKLSLTSVPVELASGQPVGPGEIVTLSAEDLKDPHNQALVDQELLLPIEKKGGGK